MALAVSAGAWAVRAGPELHASLSLRAMRVRRMRGARRRLPRSAPGPGPGANFFVEIKLKPRVGPSRTNSDSGRSVATAAAHWHWH
jgi:hypothetical protein